MMLVKDIKRIAAAGAAAFVFAAFAAVNGFCASATYDVDSVIDGDTIRLSNGKLVRYIGVDTPEVRKREARGWKYAPERFAEEARDRNGEFAAGKTVVIEFDDQKEDKYGRWLGYVYSREVMINEEMLRSGLAVFTLYPPNFKYADRLIRAEEEARSARRGIWSDCPVISAAEARNYVDRVVCVRDKVISVSVRNNSFFLNFKRDAARGFSGVIWKRNIPFFPDNGRSIEGLYSGKTIELTGKIKNSNGLEMIVFHPSQIKIID